jgi:hypothetical protein
MPGLISKPHGEDLDFELFSNIVLKFTAILMVVLVLLAINTGQKLDQVISPYRFSGGSARPQLYYSAWATPGGRNNSRTTIALYSTSYAQANDLYIDPATNETHSSTEAVSFGGRFYARPYFALEVLDGISQDAFPVNGQESPFIVANFDPKGYSYIDKTNKKRTTPASEQIGRGVLKLWSLLYANRVYATRAFAEYRNINVRIYVQTCVEGGQHEFLIGDQMFTAAQVKAGSADFLTALSSTNTEVVYLGDCSGDVETQRQNRLNFYATHGFAEAAKHLRSRFFPDAADRERAKDAYNLLPGWDQLSPEQRSTWVAGAKGNANLARSRFETSNAREATIIYRNALLEDAIEKDVKPEPYALPSVLAYPDAWQAFVEARQKSAQTPPEWFITEFLRPLGFDKRVMVLGE